MSQWGLRSSWKLSKVKQINMALILFSHKDVRPNRLLSPFSKLLKEEDTKNDGGDVMARLNALYNG